MSDSLDKSKQFTISAHVVRQLGEQLISDEITALIELVKNAYDADARRVSIIVNTGAAYQEEDLAPSIVGNKASTGYILITDNGTGMDEADINKGWLQISFSKKRGFNKAGDLTDRFKRSVLGSKGVGRLSAQRLGDRLDLFSLKEYYKKEEDAWYTGEVGVHVGINWNSFQENVSLQDVPVFFKNWMPKNNRPGTKLIISDLQNPKVWDDAKSRSALISTLAQLISPFDPAKAFNINIKINNIPYDLFELTKGVRDTAISTYRFQFNESELIIKGKVKANIFRGNNNPSDVQDYQQLIASDNGFLFYNYLINTKGMVQLTPGTGGWFFEYEIRLQASSLGLREKVVRTPNKVEDNHNEDQPTIIASPGPFYGEIDQLAYENEEVSSGSTVFTQLGDYKAFIKQQSGIRIYRDGFGIRPYGIDGDDWMGLQASQTSGKSFYTLRPKNVIGYISLTAKDNGILEEKTDREGFVLNDESRNFFILSYRIRDEINNVITRVRRRFNDYKKTQAESVAQITSPKEALVNLRHTAQQVEKLREKTTKTNFENVDASINKKINAIRQNPLLESGNDAGLQKLLEDVSDELKKSKEIQNISTEIQDKLKHLDPVASSLESQLQILNNQLADFSELASVGLTAEALSHEIENIVDRLLAESEKVAYYLSRQSNPASEIILFTERVQTSLRALQKQTQHLDPSLRYKREKREEISIPSFMNGVRSFYEERTRFKEANIKFLIENASTNNFNILCSRGKLTQVFDNIIINSEYWLRESLRLKRISEPTITIRLLAPYIEIFDNGLGIDPGIIPYLFQPFVTTKPKEMGRGLGLFISHQLLESMGSTIELLPTLNQFQRPYIFRIDLTSATHG